MHASVHHDAGQRATTSLLALRARCCTCCGALLKQGGARGGHHPDFGTSTRPHPLRGRLLASVLRLLLVHTAPCSEVCGSSRRRRATPQVGSTRPARARLVRQVQPHAVLELLLLAFDVSAAGKRGEGGPPSRQGDASTVGGASTQLSALLRRGAQPAHVMHRTFSTPQNSSIFLPPR